jgi:hypothetical protein
MGGDNSSPLCAFRFQPVLLIFCIGSNTNNANELGSTDSFAVAEATMLVRPQCLAAATQLEIIHLKPHCTDLQLIFAVSD